MRACVCVCVCTSMHECTHMYVHTCVRTCVHACVLVRLRIYACVHAYLCMLHGLVASHFFLFIEKSFHVHTGMRVCLTDA